MCRATVCIFLLLGPGFGGYGQTQDIARKAGLVLSLRPVRPVFELGTDITMEFTLKNVSRHRMLATRGASLHDLIYMDVIDRRGRRVSWQGVIPSRSYPQGFFVILEPGQSSTFQAVISSANGAGYQIRMTGPYRARALFSLSPKEYFAPVSNGADVPDYSVVSNWTHFSVVATAPERGRKAK